MKNDRPQRPQEPEPADPALLAGMKECLIEDLGQNLRRLKRLVRRFEDDLEELLALSMGAFAEVDDDALDA